MTKQPVFQIETTAKLLACIVVLLVFQVSLVAEAPEKERKTMQNCNGIMRRSEPHNWHMCDFTPPLHLVAPRRNYEGTLKFSPVGAGSYMRILRDEFKISNVPGVSRFPEVSLDFVQNGTDFIPVQRGTIEGQHPYWETIFEPGKIWEDQLDPENSRVALPFSLQERNANCIHNGVMTFLLRPNNIIDSLHYQVSGETCAYFQFDMWGTLRGHYQPDSFSNSANIKTNYHKEVSVRLPVRNFKALKQTYPSINVQNLLSRNSEHTSVYGLLVNGINYRSNCRNRFGSYPFCDVLDLPSFSTAKSMFAALAMMRLEKLYPGIQHITVGELIEECQADGSWKDVTLSHLLNMVSGHYQSKMHEADENLASTRQFFLSEQHSEKIKLACTLYPRRKEPGRNWVYHTTDTYLAGTMMNKLLNNRSSAQQTQQKDIYENVMIEEIWQPLNLSPVLNTTRRTYDKVRQPFTGWGLTYHLDDILRLSVFLNAQANLVNGQSLFDEQILRAALQKDPKDRGYKAINSKFRYNNGFWAYNIASAIRCKDALWVPFMSGYGGITVALFPNGIVYYAYSDNHEFAWVNAAKEVDKIMPMCIR